MLCILRRMSLTLSHTSRTLCCHVRPIWKSFTCTLGQRVPMYATPTRQPGVGPNPGGIGMLLLSIAFFACVCHINGYPGVQHRP